MINPVNIAPFLGSLPAFTQYPCARSRCVGYAGHIPGYQPFQFSDAARENGMADERIMTRAPCPCSNMPMVSDANSLQCPLKVEKPWKDRGKPELCQTICCGSDRGGKGRPVTRYHWTYLMGGCSASCLQRAPRYKAFRAWVYGAGHPCFAGYRPSGVREYERHKKIDACRLLNGDHCCQAALFCSFFALLLMVA